MPEAAEPRAITGERRGAVALLSLQSRLLSISLEPNNAYVHASFPCNCTHGDAHRSHMINMRATMNCLLITATLYHDTTFAPWNYQGISVWKQTTKLCTGLSDGEQNKVRLQTIAMCFPRDGWAIPALIPPQRPPDPAWNSPQAYSRRHQKQHRQVLG